MPIFPSPSAECPVHGKYSVSVDSHHIVIFILLHHLSSPGEAGVTSQRQQIPQAMGSLLGPQFTPFLPIVHLTEYTFKGGLRFDFKFCLEPTGSSAEGPSLQIITRM